MEETEIRRVVEGMIAEIPADDARAVVRAYRILIVAGMKIGTVSAAEMYDGENEWMEDQFDDYDLRRIALQLWFDSDDVSMRLRGKHWWEEWREAKEDMATAYSLIYGWVDGLAAKGAKIDG